MFRVFLSLTDSFLLLLKHSASLTKGKELKNVSLKYKVGISWTPRN